MSDEKPIDVGSAGGRRVHVSLDGLRVDDVIDDLRDAGLGDVERLDDLGIVTGTAAPETIERMRRMRGVSVEAETEVQLPPPEAPVQ